MQRFNGWLDVAPIAACVTDGLVEQFGCAFARLWVVTPERDSLKLMASSGLYERLDGAFATVPMGAFKVGKIAQHCIPFLSNDLAEESWVKDRDWAIANQIRGFAGLPLMLEQEAIGVLAVFSKAPLSAEFLEVLQILSIATTGAIATAQVHERQQPVVTGDKLVLSERLNELLGQQCLSLIGRELPLPGAVEQVLLAIAQQVRGLAGHYCRLMYEAEAVTFEGMVATEDEAAWEQVQGQLSGLAAGVEGLGGRFELGRDGAIGKLWIQLPVVTRGLVPGVSERERQVLELLAQGARDREVAERLYISERTVKFHVKNILAKLEVRTRVQAVYQATKQGWID